MSKSFFYAEVPPTAGDPPSALSLTSRNPSQPNQPGSHPSTPSAIGKIRCSLSSAVGGTWRSIRISGHPFCRNPKPDVQILSPISRAGTPALVRSECEQGRIHPLPDTNIIDKDSVSSTSDESWERRECANCRLCADARQREALALDGNIVQLRPPSRPRLCEGLGKTFSAVTNPESEKGTGHRTIVKYGVQLSDLFSDESEGGEEVKNTNGAVVPFVPAGRLEDALPPPFSTRPPMSWKKLAEKGTKRRLAAHKMMVARDKAEEGDWRTPRMPVVHKDNGAEALLTESSENGGAEEVDTIPRPEATTTPGEDEDDAIPTRFATHTKMF